LALRQKRKQTLPMMQIDETIFLPIFLLGIHFVFLCKKARTRRLAQDTLWGAALFTISGVFKLRYGFLTRILYADFSPKSLHFILQTNLGETISDERGEEADYGLWTFSLPHAPAIFAPRNDRKMKTIQEAFLESEQVSILSHSVTPD